MLIPIALAAYAAVLLGIALLSLKNTASMDDFLVGGRKNRKLLIVASMLASTIGGGLTIGTVQKASTMGFAAFWFVAAGALAHFLQGGLLSKKVRESGTKTLAELADKVSGKESRLITSAIILITWTGISAAQFLALSKVLTSLTGMEHNLAIAAGAAFIILYTLIGGQKSVLRTDLFQFGVLAIALVTSVAWLYIAKPPAVSPVITLFTASFGPLDLLYYVVVMGGSYFICPMMFSRLMSADTAANARKSSFLSGTGMLIFAFIVTFIGLWVSTSGFITGQTDPLNALAMNVLPGPLGVLLVFGLLAAIASTADTVLLTASSIVQNDLIKKPSVAGVRIWIVVVGAIAAFVALFHSDIIGLLMRTYNGYTAGLVPAMFVALLYARFENGASARKPSALLFSLALILGYGLGMAGSFAEGNLAKILPLAGMAVSTSLAILSFRTQQRKAV